MSVVDDGDDSALIVLYREDDDYDDYYNDDGDGGGGDDDERCHTSDNRSSVSASPSPPPSISPPPPANEWSCVFCGNRLVSREDGASLLCDRSPSSGRSLATCFIQLMGDQLQLPSGGDSWNESSRGCADCCRVLAYADSLDCQLQKLRSRLMLAVQVSACKQTADDAKEDGANGDSGVHCLSDDLLVSSCDQFSLSTGYDLRENVVRVKMEQGQEEDVACKQEQDSCEGENELNVEVLTDQLRCRVCGQSYTDRLLYFRHMLSEHDLDEQSAGDCPASGGVGVAADSTAPPGRMNTRKRRRLTQKAAAALSAKGGADQEKILSAEERDKLMARGSPRRIVVIGGSRNLGGVVGVNRTRRLRHRLPLPPLPPPHLIETVAFESAPLMRRQLERIVRYPKRPLGDSGPATKRQIRRISHLLNVDDRQLWTQAPTGGCDRCGLAVDTLKELQEHKRVVHGVGAPIGEEARQYLSKPLRAGSTMGGQCPICHKYLRNRLQRHIDAHERHGDTMCPLCRKQFSRRDALDAHIKSVHIRERNFVCGQCGKTFVTLYSMQRHQLIHTGAFRYRCKQCCAGFRQKSQLVVHMRRRHGITKQMVDDNILIAEVDAEAAASEEAAAAAAMAPPAADTNQLRYMCQECGGAFIRRRALTIHMRSVHRVENVVYENVQLHLADEHGETGQSVGSVLLASSADPTATVYIDAEPNGNHVLDQQQQQHGHVDPGSGAPQTQHVDTDTMEARAVVAAALAASGVGDDHRRAPAENHWSNNSNNGGSGDGGVAQCRAVYVNVNETLEQIVEGAGDDTVFVTQSGLRDEGGELVAADGAQFHHMSAEEAVQMVQETTVVTDEQGGEWW